MGQAKAEHLPSGNVPNASSLTKSRSIDFVSLSPGTNRASQQWCFKTSDQAEKEYGAATVDKLTYTLPFAASVNEIAAAQGTRRRLAVLS